MLEVGQKAGNYKVIQKLGQGGMGAVFEGVHEFIERRAAIKVLFPDLSKNPQFAARFLNEARAVNLIRHPGLVEIFEFGLLPDGTAYIIMEFLDGESLTRRIARKGGAMGAEALSIARQIALALSAAHAKEIIHRDLKPDNVMLVPDQERPDQARVKVLDFGIAKMAARSGPVDPHFKTETGTTIGTPEYMAPEQCTGAAIDGKVDVYSLGVVLYQMLSGQLPFEANHSFDYMALHVRGTPRPLKEAAPHVDEDVTALVHRLLAKDPAARPTMPEVARELERLGASQAAIGSMPTIPADPVDSGIGTAPTLSIDAQSPVSASVAGASSPRTGAQPRRQARLALMLGCLALAALVAVWGIAIHGKSPPVPQRTAAAPPAAAPPAAPAAAPRAPSPPAPAAATPPAAVPAAAAPEPQKDPAGTQIPPGGSKEKVAEVPPRRTAATRKPIKNTDNKRHGADAQKPGAKSDADKHKVELLEE